MGIFLVRVPLSLQATTTHSDRRFVGRVFPVQSGSPTPAVLLCLWCPSLSTLTLFYTHLIFVSQPHLIVALYLHRHSLLALSQCRLVAHRLVLLTVASSTLPVQHFFPPSSKIFNESSPYCTPLDALCPPPRRSFLQSSILYIPFRRLMRVSTTRLHPSLPFW